MSDATLTLLLLGLGTYALKSAGPLLMGGRPLPRWTDTLAALAPAALLAALVAVSTVASGNDLVLDTRLAGLAAAALALRLRAPFVLVVVLAAAATALARSLGG